MSRKPSDLTAIPDLSEERGTEPIRDRRPVYVDLLPPCNHACPAGENIQAWLAEGQAGRNEQAWRVLTADNPFPSIHGRVCYHPCEDSCNRKDLDSSVSIHGVERYLGDLALKKGWQFEREVVTCPPWWSARNVSAGGGFLPRTIWRSVAEPGRPRLGRWFRVPAVVPERAMWTLGVVMPAPLLNQDRSLFRGIEDFRVQQLISEFAVEALAIAVFPRAAGLDE